jgi:hypothetical protein
LVGLFAKDTGTMIFSPVSFFVELKNTIFTLELLKIKIK